MYELVAYATSPVLLATAKSFMRVTSTAEDTLIQSLIDAATEWCEDYTGRQFRENTWQLSLDEFYDRIDIRRSPVKEITSITHIVSGAPVTVDASTYYLKNLTQLSEVLLVDGKAWPTNTDVREQAIVISFTSAVYARALSRFTNAVLQLVSYLYENRGDCDCGIDSAIASGATKILNQFRIVRV